MTVKNKDKAGNWQPGQSGNPRGRRPGTPNRVTLEAKAICNRLVDDPAYQKALLKRLRAGELHSAVETMLWYYAKGKPKERVEIGADKSLAALITEAVLGAAREREPDDA